MVLGKFYQQLGDMSMGDLSTGWENVRLGKISAPRLAASLINQSCLDVRFPRNQETQSISDCLHFQELCKILQIQKLKYPASILVHFS